MHFSMQIILEGMGRALHTNFNAQFKCEALKVMVHVMFLYFADVSAFFLAEGSLY